MVLILHQYPRSLDSFSPPSTSSSSSDTPVDWASPSSSSTDTLAQTGFPSQWNRLPLQQERVALQSRTTILPVHSDLPTNSRNAPTTAQKSLLQINTAVFSRLDYSSTSSMSASTMTSDPPSSIDTDAEDASNGTDRDIVPKTEDEGESGIEEIRRLDSSESPDIKGDLVMRNTSNTKKRRGRPRKNPQPSFIAGAKQPKGRSKTGCLTCRRRKKKCDENKPSCNNCQKNAVVCEGYPPRELWKSGKQRSEGLVRRLSFNIPKGLPFLLEGIETDIDRRFLDHFVYELSQVLVVHDNSSNPFKDILLPMATQHKGLMHSLMALSGSHIVSQDPLPALNERQQHHSHLAVRILLADITRANEGSSSGEEGLIVEDPTIASTIVHCLIVISEGLTNGEYRAPFEAARKLIADQKSKNPEFQDFILEFFTFHDVSNAITSLTRRQSENEDALPDFVFQEATTGPRAGAMIGVIDGLYKYLKKITALRDAIRDRKARGLQPVVLYEYLSRAVDIDAAIHSWDSKQEPNTYRWVAGELFRQCTWVYLYRTIQASKPNLNLCSAVDRALEYLKMLPPHDSTMCVLLLPIFILGCAAFEQRQRPEIEKCFDNIQEYSKLGNIRPARRIVWRVWEMMDAGDERSWDWETIMMDMGVDLLVT